MTSINQNLIGIRKDMGDIKIEQVGHAHRIIALELTKKEKTKVFIGAIIAGIGAVGAIIAAAIQALKK